MERRNLMLDKFKDMKEKGKEFMARIKANDENDSRLAGTSAVEGVKNKPDKNLVFGTDELRGKC